MGLLCSLCELQPPCPSPAWAQLSFSMLPWLLGLPQSLLAQWLQFLAGMDPGLCVSLCQPVSCPTRTMQNQSDTAMAPPLALKGPLVVNKEGVLPTSCHRRQTALGREKKFLVSPSKLGDHSTCFVTGAGSCYLLSYILQKRRLKLSESGPQS